MSIHCKSCRRDLEPSDYAEGYKTCNSCRVKSKGKYKKHTIEECKKFAQEKGGLCLSEKYVNNNTKMLWKCAEGHQWSAIYSNIKKGSCCPECNNNAKKHTIEECKQTAEEKGGLCLSEKYVNAHSKMLWKCSENHEWSANYNDIKNGGSWCPECSGNVRLTIEECKKFAEEKGGLCLSEKYVNGKTKMLWKCSENHEWEAVYDSIKRGYWCPECSGKAKHTIEECKKFAEEKGGLCLTDEYVNNRTKMMWRCSENHEWEAIYNSIKRGRWCPDCSASRSEKLCREILEQHFNERFPNVRPLFLNGLELDGYNEKLNIAFEYNGEQHYKYVPHFHRGGEDDFKQQLERDRKKYRICAERGIKLILVPYKFNCYNPEKLKIFILDALATLMNCKDEHKVVTI